MKISKIIKISSISHLKYYPRLAFGFRMIEIYLILLSFSSFFLKSKYFIYFFKSISHEKNKILKTQINFDLEMYSYIFNLFYEELTQMRKNINNNGTVWHSTELLPEVVSNLLSKL